MKLTYLLTVCIGVPGLIGNIIAFMGFQKQCKKTPTTFLFQALAVADSFLIVAVISYDVVLFLLDTFPNIFIYAQACFVTMEIAILSSNGVTVVLAGSRLIAVCLPLRASQLCSKFKVWIYLTGTILFAICYNIPRILSMFDISPISWYTMSYVYRPFVYCIIPVTIITSITIILIVKLRSINRLRAQMTRSQQQSNNATRVLIAVLIVFLICSIPWPVMILVIYINPFTDILFYENIVWFFHVVNSSANFIVYTTLSKQYREVVLQMCCCSSQSTSRNVPRPRNVERPGRETHVQS